MVPTPLARSGLSPPMPLVADVRERYDVTPHLLRLDRHSGMMHRRPARCRRITLAPSARGATRIRRAADELTHPVSSASTFLRWSIAHLRLDSEGARAASPA